MTEREMKVSLTQMQAVIFDLDGVLVDTAKFHYLAWKKIADKYGLTFTYADNELLKGVSRHQSLEIILQLNDRQLSEEQKKQILVDKNDAYLSLIATLSENDVLPGVTSLIEAVKQKGLKIALGSASKNAPVILQSTGLHHQFDQIVDGNMVTNAKPNPEVFLTAAKLLGVEAKRCLVIEDAEAGVEAAIAAEMQVIGVGDKEILKRATVVVESLTQCSI